MQVYRNNRSVDNLVPRVSFKPKLETNYLGVTNGRVAGNPFVLYQDSRSGDRQPMYSQTDPHINFAVQRGRDSQQYLAHRLPDGNVSRSVVVNARQNRIVANSAGFVQGSSDGPFPPSALPPPGHVDTGGIIGAAGAILGGAATGAGLLGEAAVVGGVAAAPVLAAGAAVAGVGYGVYRLGESLHLW
jgi:hypothetical protein